MIWCDENVVCGVFATEMDHIAFIIKPLSSDGLAVLNLVAQAEGGKLLPHGYVFELLPPITSENLGILGVAPKEINDRVPIP